MDTKLIADVIAKSGYRKRFISDKMGMSYAVFISRITGKTCFKTPEIVKFCSVLGVDSRMRDRIFFAQEVD